MVTIVLLIGVVNFGIGFGLAVYLRHSPQVDLFMPRFGPLGLHVPLPRVALPQWRLWRERLKPADVVAPESPVTADVSPPSAGGEARSLNELLAATNALVESVKTEFGDRAAPTAELSAEVDARFVPKVLGALLSDAKRYRGELFGIEDQLHSRLEDSDERPLDLVLAHYQRANSDWAKRLFADAERLHTAQDFAADEQAIVRAAEDLLYDQAAQISEICTDREPLGLAEVRAECRQLMGDVGELTDLAHALRDQVSDGLRQLSGAAGVPVAATIDELTGLPNLAGLDAWLTKWRNTNAPATVAMVDVDRFRLVNERLGHRGCDRMLAALARLFEELFQQDGVPGIVARTAGATFALVWEARSVADATESVERIRQSLEATTFDFGGTDSTITVSGAVCSLTAATTTAALLRRLQAALVTAKRAGRNRTCAEAGTGLQIVTPVRMAIASRSITLQRGDAP